jgi:hypothetical protein
MRALSRFAATAVLLATLVACPSALIAARDIVHQVTSARPDFASPIREAEYWGHRLRTVADGAVLMRAVTVAKRGPELCSKIGR